MDDGYDRDDIRAEFAALRQETLSTINGRVWGVVTYIALAGGVGALYERAESSYFLVILVFAALPFLWHTAIRERSRMRMRSYIKRVLEPESDLYWETALEAWRARHAGTALDRWRHMLGLTGVYLLIALAATVHLLKSPASWVERLLAIVGMVLCAEALLHLNGAYVESKEYDETFSGIREKRNKTRAVTSSMRTPGAPIEGNKHDEPESEQPGQSGPSGNLSQQDR